MCVSSRPSISKQSHFLASGLCVQSHPSSANNQDPNTEILSAKHLKGLLLSWKDAGQDLPNHQWQLLFAPGILLVAGNRICFLISIPKITEDSRWCEAPSLDRQRQSLSPGRCHPLPSLRPWLPARQFLLTYWLLHPEMGQGHRIRAK